jgi:hypothetical protein
VEDLVAILLVAAVLVGVIVVVARGPRHGRGGAVMIDAINEIYHPAAHLAKDDLRSQEERGVSTETPDDFDPPWRELESHPVHRTPGTD